MKTLVAGAGGFIGGHLTKELRRRSTGEIRAVDVKPPSRWWQRHEGVENVTADLRDPSAARAACDGCGRVFNLAADMGGIGFIETKKADCMLNVLINTNMLLASRDCGVERYFFSSSACVYAADKQTAGRSSYALREEDAYPAMPEDGYGWEKLFSERMCRHFAEDYGLDVRVARFHNSYGPLGTWRGGREKAPAAVCRKVIEAKYGDTPEIEVWGDGEQLRTFMWVEDNVEGILRMMEADVPEPLNLGSAELVSINDLVSLAEEFAGVQLKRRYLPDKPVGVAGRSSDNTRLRNALGGWEPRTPLREGLRRTFDWIEQQGRKQQSS